MTTVATDLIGTPSHSSDPETGRKRSIMHAVEFTDECTTDASRRKLIKYIHMINTSFVVELSDCAPGDITSGFTEGIGMNLGHRPKTIKRSVRQDDPINEFAARVGITPERLEEIIWEHVPRT